MAWNQQQINNVAVGSAPADYAAFEAIGLSEVPNARILDIGCFDGFNTVLKFAPYENAAQIVGLDPYEEALEQARERTDDPRFSWVLGTLDSFQDAEGFNLVYLSHTFQHLPDKQAALRKIYELLAPGGFVVIKTVDDSAKISSPDPERLMEQVHELYEQAVRPNVWWTADTDRNNGGKCFSLLVNAGFEDAVVKIYHTDTIGMSAEERDAFFGRMTYFRKNVPDAAGPEARERMADLLTRWHELFVQPDYYFDSPTFVAIARKPLQDEAGDAGDSKTAETAGNVIGAEGANNAGGASGSFAYFGPDFTDAPAPAHRQDALADGSSDPQAAAGASDPQAAADPSEPQAAATSSRWRISPMTETDLGGVMAIEVRSFPSPWTPLAYAMELRHNPAAHYMVARDGNGRIGGFVGWWYGDNTATIAHIAVDPELKRQGLGRMLLKFACDAAKDAGKAAMQLQVRKANETARAFYRALGFNDMGITQNYYTNPDDDGIIMARML